MGQLSKPWRDQAIPFGTIKRSQYADGWGRRLARDSQRQKCYDAEREFYKQLRLGPGVPRKEVGLHIPSSPRVKGVPAAIDFINERLDSAEYRALWPTACEVLRSKLTVRGGKGLSDCYVDSLIEIRLNQRKGKGVIQEDILHELGHAINGAEMRAQGFRRESTDPQALSYAGHGPEWLGTLLAMTEIEIGAEAANLFAVFCDSYKARYTDGTYGDPAPAEDVPNDPPPLVIHADDEPAMGLADGQLLPMPTIPAAEVGQTGQLFSMDDPAVGGDGIGTDKAWTSWAEEG